MTRVIRYTLILVVAILASCSQNPKWMDQQQTGDQGTLNLNCFTSLTVNTKATSTDYKYAIEIRNASNEIVYTTEDHTQIGTGVKLAAGEYTVFATSGSATIGASRTPCYTGSQKVTIEAGKTTNVTLTTSLDNVKVTAVVEQAVSDFFPKFDLVVTNEAEGTLDFEKVGTSVGYFRNSGTLKWAFTILNSDGSTRTVSGIIEQTNVRDHYTLQFKLGDPVADDKVDISHEVENINHSYTISIGMGGETKTAHQLSATNPWARFAYISGEWTSDERPADLAIEYRAKGSDSWSKAAVTDADGKSFTACIKELTAETAYEVRSFSSTETSAPKEFTTEATPNIENMNMDTWTQKGKNWYANATAEDVYWGSGNEGVTSFLAGSKPSNTAPTDDSRSGKAAKLESIKVSVVNFAAGNLFTGSFKMNTLKPLDSPSFGQPYTGRPTQLKFWYKYAPKQWNTPVENDKCTVYILLGTWGGQIKSSQINGLQTDGVVAYGSFVSDQQVDAYTQHTINLEYKDLTTKPTRIIIVASSSLLGEKYDGALGSTLFIDDFEFGWDAPAQ